MRTVKIGNEIIEDFSVTDSYHNPVTGLNLGHFDVKIYNNNGGDLSGSVSTNLQELGNGDYRLLFTPNTIGLWSVVLKHPIYFPFGKGNDITVEDYDMGDIGDMIKRVLGLTQENYFVDNTIFDSEGNMTTSRIRIYSDSVSVGTPNNIINSYDVSASYTNNQLDTYSVKKV